MAVVPVVRFVPQRTLWDRACDGRSAMASIGTPRRVCRRRGAPAIFALQRYLPLRGE